MIEKFWFAVAFILDGLITMTAFVVRLGVPRYQFIRKHGERFLSTRVVRLTLLAFATITVLLEYLPEHIPFATLGMIGLLVFLEIKVGKIRPGFTWLFVLGVYELWVWVTLISVPFLAFSGQTSDSASQIFSFFHSLAIAYVLLDMAATDPRHRRRKREKVAGSIWSRLGEGMFNPLPAPVPVPISTR